MSIVSLIDVPLGGKVWIKVYCGNTIDWHNAYSRETTHEVYAVGCGRHLGLDCVLIACDINFPMKKYPIADVHNSFAHLKLIDDPMKFGRFVWPAFADRIVMLAEVFPNQKCSQCNIPLPHIRLDNPICSTCKFIQEME